MLNIPVEEIAAGDYSPDYGTVEQVVERGDKIILTFKNGKVLNQTKGNEIEIQQGGRFERGTDEE